MSDLTKLDKEVMNMLLDGDDDVLKSLRRQFQNSKIKKREMTGCGFFLYFEINSNIDELLNGKSFELGDVSAEISGMAHGAGFLLFIRDGYISDLEGFSFDESWPEQVTDFELSYHSGTKRDLTALKKIGTR
jgi:hypothetical protein